MKKTKFIGFPAALVLAALICCTAHASYKIDVSNTDSGLVVYEYAGDLAEKSIHASCELSGGSRITPRMHVNPSVLPLNMGVGSYSFKLLEKLPNGKGRVLTDASAILGANPDEMVIYTASNMNVDFNSSVVCIPQYKKLTAGLGESDSVDKIYEEIVNNYTYDHDKAAGVLNKTITDYLPDIDLIYAAKTGICFDYSAVFAGSLRSQGVPVKLCKGYADGLGEYHAWNEIYLNGRWIVVDTTVDAVYAGAKMEYKFEKDSKTYKASSYF